MEDELSDSDAVWNRAATEDGGALSAPGDLALAALLHAHGLIMNGGVLHAVELLTEDERSDAQNGFRFFGLAEVASLLSRAKHSLDEGQGLDDLESRLDSDYTTLVPDDSFLYHRFESRFRDTPRDFSPIG
ncbi:MAG: hypothetical protein CMJ47_13315 [Planctomyces sp.]|nr:hypothetical protein [Planctomyces sp.]